MRLIKITKREREQIYKERRPWIWPRNCPAFKVWAEEVLTKEIKKVPER